MYTNVRKYTNKLLEKLESGELDWEQVCRECLSEMSEDSVKDMCVTTEFVDVDDEDCQELFLTLGLTRNTEFIILQSSTRGNNMIEFWRTTEENPFGSAIEYYKHIAEFFETKANQFVKKFVEAIPANNLKNELYVWNDTGIRPAIRVEFHVDVTDTWRDCITCSMKEQKDGSFKYIVERSRKYEKFICTTEEEAMNCITAIWKRIFNE